MITCTLRYVIDPYKLAEFEEYARLWIPLVNRLGGTHHGYFVPGDAPPGAAFSFPGIGETGPNDIAVALFSVPSVEAYEKYRREVPADAECIAVTRHYDQTKCFTKYERTFMKAVPR